MLVIPWKFQDKLSLKESAQVQIILDGTKSNTAKLASDYLYAIINNFIHDIIVKEWQISTS